MFAKRRMINANGLMNTLRNFHRNQNKFNPQWHSRRIKNMTPVMFVGTDQNHYK